MLQEGGNYNDMISAQSTEPQPITSETKPPLWIERHPYIAAGAGLSALILIGMGIVLQRIGVSPASSSGSWGGAGGAFFSTVRNASTIRPNVDVPPSAATEDYATIPIFDTSMPEEDIVPEGLTELLATIVRPVIESEDTLPETPSAYSFIPQGLVSTESPARERTAEQDALHSFGNAVGTLVQPFESSAKFNAQSLKDHVEDRDDPSKIARVESLALNLAQLGVDILGIQNVPPGAQAAHKEYGTAYRILGTQLSKLTSAGTDDEFLDAIVSYNTAAEQLTKKFLMLVAIFNANGVTFSASEPGSIFMFSISGAL